MFQFNIKFLKEDIIDYLSISENLEDITPEYIYEVLNIIDSLDNYEYILDMLLNKLSTIDWFNDFKNLLSLNILKNKEMIYIYLINNSLCNDEQKNYLYKNYIAWSDIHDYEWIRTELSEYLSKYKNLITITRHREWYDNYNRNSLIDMNSDNISFEIDHARIDNNMVYTKDFFGSYTLIFKNTLDELIKFLFENNNLIIKLIKYKNDNFNKNHKIYVDDYKINLPNGESVRSIKL